MVGAFSRSVALLGWLGETQTENFSNRLGILEFEDNNSGQLEQSAVHLGQHGFEILITCFSTSHLRRKLSA
jgi:hypothetical protein